MCNTLVHPIVALTIIVSFSSTAGAQILSDPLEEIGNETYSGGFGSFNWVDATSFGFANHAGPEAFLSNYSGTPLVDIGMTKPLDATIEEGSYRVSFYYSRYSSVNAVPYSDYDQLYIGSENGTMTWDTVPTPLVSGEWVKWSGTFTPAAMDIGEPFVFGLSLTLNSNTSLAIDGPLEIVHLGNTAIDEGPGPDHVQVIGPIDGERILLNGNTPIDELWLFDAIGRKLPVTLDPTNNEINITHLPHGHYSVVCVDRTGAVGFGRFVR